MARKTTKAGDHNSLPPEIQDQHLGKLLSERYLAYALSTIMSRSLPDVRDGLKPVQRRILFAMSELKLDPANHPKKSARVVGDVIGKFHPHGDQSVYDALVRLAQDFAVRYPLVDGQGNFGNIDGDNAAAMRYTEARMTLVSRLLLEGIEEDAVDFRSTYDGETAEPIVLPAAFPNLLANGTSGIAVGMATNIPPHNVAEICDALLLILDKPDPTPAELYKCIPGPDFPTGGILIEPKENVVEAYKTGKGSFRLRARWEKEELKGGSYQIVVTEIPYQVQKSRLIEKIAELITERKIQILDDVRDESAEDIRLVLVPKSRNVEPEILMEALFRSTDLETRFSLNMNALEGGRVPKVMTLREVLQAYLDHRKDVLVRRSHHRLEKILHRIEVLDGYLIVYLNIDDVIKIIREEDEPKIKLMKKFGLSDVQAEAILNMRLRSLRRLEEIEIKTEHKNLSKERDDLNKLLKSESLQWGRIKDQTVQLREQFGPKTDLGRRRTVIGKPPTPMVVENLEDALTVREPITMICSAKGWVRAMKGHGVNEKELKFKEGDRSRFMLECQTTDKIIAFATNGRFYTFSCDKLPPGRGFGEPVRLMVDLPNDADFVTMTLYNSDQKFLVATLDGRGFIVPSSECFAQTKSGKNILGVDHGSEAAVCVPIQPDHTHLALVGTNRKMLVIPLSEVPEMNKGKGVSLQKFTDGQLSDARSFKMKEGLSFKYGAGETVVNDMKPWLGKRAQTGKLPPNGFPKNNLFS